MPAAALTKKGVYKAKNSKTVPNWGSAQKLVPCVTELVRASSGHGIKHTAMRQGVLDWNVQQEFGFDSDKVDEIAYALRLIINQLLNMKFTRPPRPLFFFEILKNQ